jgi:uncharacterized damage-inducible protein DinB
MGRASARNQSREAPMTDRSAPSAMDPSIFRGYLLALFERESATTLRVLRAYPEEQAELQPHPVVKTARELAWLFTMEQKIALAAIADSLDLSAGFPPAPATLGEVISSFEKSRTELIDALRTCAVDQLTGTVRFPTGPKQVGDIPKLPFIEFLIHDQIHHRGQFSIYLRLAGGKVPSIYGPTADEPWR